MTLSDGVRERVDRFLADLAAAPLARHVLAVVVCGSAARGEEIWAGSRLESDIDLMLVTRRTSPRLTAAADAVIGPHRAAGIDGGPVPLGPLRHYATLLFYETRASGVAVAGDLRPAELIPPLRPEDIPPWEGFRVLANRLLEHVKLAAGAVSAERAAAKSYEALAEAHLVAEGRYRPSYATRLEELERRPPAGVGGTVAARLTGALRRRLDGAGAVADPDTARRDLLAGLARLGECCSGRPGGPTEQLALLARGPAHWRQRAWWSALMLTQGRWASITPHMDPSMRIWQRALAAVTRPGGCAADPRLLEDWRRCPQVLRRRHAAR
jgi:hypothetical protein